ncbi:hypothetical protein U8C37_09195 [Sinorhizobium medicae]|nr:hypothetical protein [Sinorhizobium medicae]WQO87500.1 hypothetical protein U8C37_09195 [Sinorhizobium medicae]
MSGAATSRQVMGPDARRGDWMQTVTGRQFWPIIREIQSSEADE